MTEQQEQMIYDEGRRRGFNDGYSACKDELAENTMERIEEDGTLVVTIADATKVTRVLVQDDKANGDLFYNDRPKGEWREERNWRTASFYSVCSECGYFDDERDDLTAYNFCPYCGADMRGEENE